MSATYENYVYYKKARRRFSIKTYILLFVWQILAILQWAVVCLIDEIRDFFIEYYYICFVAFILAVLLFGIFIFVEKLRYIPVLNFIICLIIVELQIIALFALVARTYWMDLIIFFVICFVLLWLFILIGSVLPRKLDLTLDVAILFIVGFLFLAIAIYFLMYRFLVHQVEIHSYIVFEVAVTIIILFFVMYHAQTINGGRFAEMRLNDALLGSLILFHDFLIIYWLTFYWQILERPFTPDDWEYFSTMTDTSSTASTTPKDYKDKGDANKVQGQRHLDDDQDDNEDEVEDKDADDGQEDDKEEDVKKVKSRGRDRDQEQEEDAEEDEAPNANRRRKPSYNTGGDDDRGTGSKRGPSKASRRRLYSPKNPKLNARENPDAGSDADASSGHVAGVVSGDKADGAAGGVVDNEPKSARINAVGDKLAVDDARSSSVTTVEGAEPGAAADEDGALSVGASAEESKANDGAVEDAERLNVDLASGAAEHGQHAEAANDASGAGAGAGADADGGANMGGDEQEGIVSAGVDGAAGEDNSDRKDSVDPLGRDQYSGNISAGNDPGGAAGGDVGGDVGSIVAGDDAGDVRDVSGAAYGATDGVAGGNAGGDVGGDAGSDVGGDVGGDVGENVGNVVGGDVRSDVGGDLRDISGATGGAAGGKTDGDVADEARRDVGGDVGADVGGDIGNVVGGDVGGDVRDLSVATAGATDAAAGGNAGGDFGNDVGDAVERVVGGDVGGDVRDVSNATDAAAGGNTGGEFGNDIGGDTGGNAVVGGDQPVGGDPVVGAADPVGGAGSGASEIEDTGSHGGRVIEGEVGANAVTETGVNPDIYIRPEETGSAGADGDTGSYVNNAAGADTNEPANGHVDGPDGNPEYTGKEADGVGDEGINAGGSDGDFNGRAERRGKRKI
ncbi:uncharacterized transmembrane protein DDB_G0289901 [Drosophila virilis]|uniref:uncharacterized transmembrane protein DDB_G0289901 n=1 Tax=Drosophila virilis TaxID=7244 RepID=UPI00139618FF|nr:uncharacterized transmembrane protein DDB_G0289901 [Drosophila virilis]